MISEEVIVSWRVPDVLKDLNIEFHFSDDFGDESLIGKGCHVDSNTNSAKFFLYDPNDKEIIFTLDFYLRKGHHNAFSTNRNIDEPCIYLQHIATSERFRKKGIATFYINRLVELCADNNIRNIALNIAVPTKNLDNALSKMNLRCFIKNLKLMMSR